MLTLPEQLLLLALHDQKGTILTNASMSIEYGLAGAVIMELALLEKVEVRNKKLVLVERSHTGDDILDQAMNLLRDSAKERDIAYWINRFTSKMKIKPSVLQRLVKQGILKYEEHKILGLFDSPHYPTRNPDEEKQIREQIRRLVLRRDVAEARTPALMGLVKACGLTNEIFTRQERKEAKQRIKEIMAGDQIAKAVADTVAGIEAALVTVIIAGGSS